MSLPRPEQFSRALLDLAEASSSSRLEEYRQQYAWAFPFLLQPSRLGEGRGSPIHESDPVGLLVVDSSGTDQAWAWKARRRQDLRAIHGNVVSATEMLMRVRASLEAIVGEMQRMQPTRTSHDAVLTQGEFLESLAAKGRRRARGEDYGEG